MRIDASTLRLAFRLALGDRPLQAARRADGHAAAERLRRGRRALSTRRQVKLPVAEPTHPG